MIQCHICKGQLTAPSPGRIGCVKCDWSLATDPDGNMVVPEFSDGPEFEGWLKRSTQENNNEST